MRAQRLIAALALCGALAIGVAACGSDDDSAAEHQLRRVGGSSSEQLGGTLNGAGATFPQPVYNEWAARFKDKAGTTVNYQGIGSGGGIAQFTAGTVDFGATDSAMKRRGARRAPRRATAVHVPTVLGAVTVSYNVAGVEDGPEARRRDDRRHLPRQGHEVERPGDRRRRTRASTLPDTDITVCHRSDESGTTKIFTQFLADYSPEWERRSGVDKTVKWPTGTGAKGNDGVAACVKQTHGAVGYVEQAYALQNNFTTADVKNKAGKYVAPTLESTSAAGEGVERARRTCASARSTRRARRAYPIASATFMLVHQDICKAGLDRGQGQAAEGAGWTTRSATARRSRRAPVRAAARRASRPGPGQGRRPEVQRQAPSP